MDTFVRKKVAGHTLKMPGRYSDMNDDDMNYGGFSAWCIPIFLSAMLPVGLSAAIWMDDDMSLGGKITVSVICGIISAFLIWTAVDVGWPPPEDPLPQNDHEFRFNYNENYFINS